MPTISVGILCFNMVLMFCGLADVVRSMVIYPQTKPMLPRMSNGWSEDQANRSTLCGCVADGLRLVCCPCRGDADGKGQSQARTFRRWHGRSEDGTKKGRDAEMIPKSQQKAVAKYNKKHYKQVLVQMNMETDADILSFLETLPSGEKAGFIRRAIREYIKILSL